MYYGVLWYVGFVGAGYMSAFLIRDPLILTADIGPAAG